MNAPAHIRLSEEGPPPERYRLRVADYLMLHESGSFRDLETELVDGEVFLMSPEWRPHFRIKSELVYLIRQAVEAAKLPFLVGTEGSVALSDTDMPRPDILLTSDARGEGPIPRESVPLVVEVSSSTLESDLGTKAERYAKAGVPELWVVDTTGRILHRLWSPGQAGYAERDQIAFGRPVSSATLPELVVSTADL